VTGTIINVAAIILGSALAMISRKDLSEGLQRNLKWFLALLAMVLGCYLLWNATHGGLWSHLKQGMLLMVSITLGNLLGLLIGIQKALNRLAVYAKEQFQQPDRANGFKVASALFCLTPLAVIGACLDGMSNQAGVLVIKAFMDGMAAHSFTRVFGKSVLLAFIPVLAFQGNLALASHWMAGSFMNPEMVDGVSGASGLTLFTAILLITDTGRPRLGDYLPSLVVAAFLAHWFW